MAKINSASVAGGGVALKAALVAGAAANTNIAIAGLKANAELVGVLAFTDAAWAVPVDELANAKVEAAGEIQVSVDTTGKHLYVLYLQGA